MEQLNTQHILLPRKVDVEVIDDLHFLLKEYLRELGKKKKEMKKEVKQNPTTAQELKGNLSLIRKLQRNASYVLDDIEFHIRLQDESGNGSGSGSSNEFNESTK